jgi:integrase
VANKARKNLSAAWEWGRAALKYFPETDSMAANPFRSVKKFSETRHPRYIPPLDDFWTVYDQVENLQDKVILMAFLHTAGRRSEIFNLKFSDLDFHSGRIRLWTRKRKDGSLEYDWIPMTAELSEKLQSWRKERLMMRAGDKEHAFV